MDIILSLFFIIVLIFSVIVHEISHGYVALYLGDHTAEDAGRLTLNPLKHIDLFGSVIVPLLLIFAGGPVFGWAKPVPYDPRFLKNPKRAAGLIAAAGPLSNFLVAAVFSALIRLIVVFPSAVSFSPAVFLLLNIIVQVNIALAVFNLIPIPPLDGSGVLFAFLPPGSYRFEAFFRHYGFFILLILIFSGVPFLSTVIFGLYKLFVGGVAASLFGI